MFLSRPHRGSRHGAAVEEAVDLPKSPMPSPWLHVHERNCLGEAALAPFCLAQRERQCYHGDAT